MSEDHRSVAEHYGVGGILDAVLEALEASGRSLEALAPVDLAPVDAFHIRGREATLELARLAAVSPEHRVLDVGCGLGGSVRHLAAEHGCRVVGVDLTPEYVDTARELARLVGLADDVEFRLASALDLPFADGEFDVVWTEHAQMNIEDERAFYAEIARVLQPGGRLVFHDVFQGEGGDVQYPVPWADDDTISFLWQPESVRATLAGLGLRVLHWADETRTSDAWFQAMLERLDPRQRPPLGLHLLLGETGPQKFRNMARNLSEDRVAVVQAVAERTA